MKLVDNVLAKMFIKNDIISHFLSSVIKKESLYSIGLDL